MPLTKELLQHHALFITGTDTGVGKTTIARAIAKEWARIGEDVCAIKAVAAGGKKNKHGEFVHSDSTKLSSVCTEYAAGFMEEVMWMSVTSPIAGFTRAMAPFTAAKLDGTSIDFGKLTKTLQELRNSCELEEIRLIIEGAGGALVPLTKTKTVADLIAGLKIPAVVVARTELGTINHTLLTVEALRSRKIEIAAVIMNRVRKGPMTLVEKAGIEEIRMMLPKNIPQIILRPAPPGKPAE